MYERNAILIDRYFNNMFGYDLKNNIKTNFKDYSELVIALEKYKNISDEEETIMQEYDSIANKIREIQKREENLNKKNIKLQEERENLFLNIDDNPKLIQKKLENLNDTIERINDEIKENAQDFIEIVDEFNEKTSVRTTCERTRRTIENDYNKKLNCMLDNYQDINPEIQKKAKQFIEIDTNDIENDLKEKIMKNGVKEKIPFNEEVILKAITLSVDIQKRETDIYANIYEKTNKLFNEIKNNNTKIDKHKKIIKDAKSRMEFVATIKEYLVQFLDNERLTAVSGEEEEHKSLMKEACKNLDEDLVQINNLYTLLLKEISKKVTKKSYHDLYNIEYLHELEKKAEQFEKEIKKLKLPVTIINPNYWRIEGMKKIYNSFYNCVTEVYGRDLSEYLPVDDSEETDDEDFEEIYEENKINNNQKKKEKSSNKKNKENDDEKEDTRTEIDRKIDMILGFDEEQNENSNSDEEDWDNDEWDDEEEKETTKNEEDEDDDLEFDIWGNSLKNNSSDDSDEIDRENEWSDKENDYEEEWSDEDEWDDDEENEMIEIDEPKSSDSQKSKNKKIKNKNNNEESTSEDWENEFINIDKKNKTKKKTGLFSKFRK